jgi:hypothetical protein
MAKTIELVFDGYYKTKQLPLNKHECSGIYTVYTGESTGEKSCILRKLLYIGESENVATRPGKEHENYEDWKTQLESGEILYYSFAEVDSRYRERAEAALIYHNKPICNGQGKKSFKYQETTITTSGDAIYLGGTFTVYPTDEDD